MYVQTSQILTSVHILDYENTDATSYIVKGLKMDGCAFVAMDERWVGFVIQKALRLFRT